MLPIKELQGRQCPWGLVRFLLKTTNRKNEETRFEDEGDRMEGNEGRLKSCRTSPQSYLATNTVVQDMRRTITILKPETIRATCSSDPVDAT